MNSINKIEASKLKYIGLYIGQSILSKLVATLIVALVYNFVYLEIYTYLIFILNALIFIFLYQKYPELKISKVMIWLWIFVIIGIIRSFILYGNEPGNIIYLLVFTAGCFSQNLIIHYKFKDTDQWEDARTKFNRESS